MLKIVSEWKRHRATGSNAVSFSFIQLLVWVCVCRWVHSEFRLIDYIYYYSFGFRIKWNEKTYAFDRLASKCAPDFCPAIWMALECLMPLYVIKDACAFMPCTLHTLSRACLWMNGTNASSAIFRIRNRATKWEKNDSDCSTVVRLAVVLVKQCHERRRRQFSNALNTRLIHLFLRFFSAMSPALVAVKSLKDFVFSSSSSVAWTEPILNGLCLLLCRCVYFAQTQLWWTLESQRKKVRKTQPHNASRSTEAAMTQLLFLRETFRLNWATSIKITRITQLLNGSG